MSRCPPNGVLCDIMLMCSVRSYSSHPIPVFRNRLIHRQQQQSLGARLRNQDAVKRILVQRRQLIYGDCVFARDGKLAIAVHQKQAPQSARIDFEVNAIKPVLDGYLPRVAALNKS